MKFDESYNLKHYFVDCVTRDSQIKNGYLAQSNFLAGLKITMEGKYDLHCTRLSKDVKGDNFTGDVRRLDISFFHRIAQTV